MSANYEIATSDEAVAFPEAQYIFRDPVENPPPPTWEELKLSEVVTRPARELVPADHVRFYSALVQASMAGEISEIHPVESGVVPSPSKVRAHAGMALAVSISPREFRTLYDQVVTTAVVNSAIRRAGEIVPYAQSPKPQRRRDSNAYDRFMSLYNLMAEANGEIVPTHYAWADVRDYYREPMAHTPAGIELMTNDSWGTCHVKDLGDYPYFGGTAAEKEDRIMLEHRFLDLDGIPQLDNLDDLSAILSDLPAGTPALCFVDNMKLVAVRVHGEVEAENLEVVELPKEAVLMLNLLMLHNLRSGRSINLSWLKKTSGYTTSKTAQAFATLRESTAGIVARSGRSRRSKSGDPHYDIPGRAFILDARQKTL